jgi:SAM-dependent methyltransferase
MNAVAEVVRHHYELAMAPEDSVEAVIGAIDALNGPIDAAQLSAFDQFHVRGLEATQELGDLLGLTAQCRVLDAGAGLGGPSRYLAQTYGCHVTGVDLAPTFVALARLLADRAGLSDRVHYQVGDLTALDLPPAAFDVVYSQHVVMNIANRSGVYRQLRRVLKTGGTFGFYDVLAVEGEAAPTYPVPWAETAATSALLTEAQTRDALIGAGLAPGPWRDVTVEAVDWFKSGKAFAPGPNLAAVMGPRFPAMAMNLAGALMDGRLRLMMGTCRAV